MTEREMMRRNKVHRLKTSSKIKGLTPLFFEQKIMKKMRKREKERVIRDGSEKS